MFHIFCPPCLYWAHITSLVDVIWHFIYTSHRTHSCPRRKDYASLNILSWEKQSGFRDYFLVLLGPLHVKAIETLCMVLGFTNQPDFDMIVRPWLWIAIEELMFFWLGSRNFCDSLVIWPLVTPNLWQLSRKKQNKNRQTTTTYDSLNILWVLHFNPYICILKHHLP